MKAWCLFEQSGTFKKEFIKLGVNAVDIDIRDDFAQTDYKMDLFAEINKSRENKISIFDKINNKDIALAFFPCTRFNAKIPLLSRGEAAQQKNWNYEKKIEYSMKIENEIHNHYQLLCKLILICIEKRIRLVIENPYTQPHFLHTYLPIKPSVIHTDRSKYGDTAKKPTQYWFINFKPKQNFCFENLQSEILWKSDYAKGENRQTLRSLISQTYANRFIREYIL